MSYLTLCTSHITPFMPPELTYLPTRKPNGTIISSLIHTYSFPGNCWRDQPLQSDTRQYTAKLIHHICVLYLPSCLTYESSRLTTLEQNWNIYATGAKEDGLVPVRVELTTFALPML